MSEQRTVTGSVWKIRGIPYMNKTLYVIDVKEQGDGDPITVGLAEQKPDFEVGTRIQLSATKQVRNSKERWNKTKGTNIQKSTQPGSMPPEGYGQQQQRSYSGNGAKPAAGSYGDPNRQAVIEYQAAQERAAHLLTAGLANGAYSLGQKKAEKHDNLMGQFRELTKEVFFDILDFEDKLKKGVPARNCLDDLPEQTPNQEENIPASEVGVVADNAEFGEPVTTDEWEQELNQEEFH